jgi:Ca2+:H+ antiporter
LKPSDGRAGEGRAAEGPQRRNSIPPLPEEKTHDMPVLLAMLIFVPISIALGALHGPAPLVFATSCLAILPLAGHIGNATQELASRRGAAVGGLLNATFGNATELIIALVALRHGEVTVVKSSLIGSILGNVLLVLGISVLAGGVKYKIQLFNRDVAQSHASMLGMAVISLLVPALFVRGAGISERPSDPLVEHLSISVACVLLLLYAGSLLFSLHTHEDLFRGDETETTPPVWSERRAMLVLMAAAAVIAVESELMVGAIGPVVASLGVSKLFLGVIVIPVVGNAAEHSTAVLMALRNRMDVSLNIATSSSTQVAMFVAPVCVFASLLLGHPMTLLYSNYELTAVTAAVAIAVLISMDGKSHWLEGAQLLATYVIVALAFFFVGGHAAVP